MSKIIQLGENYEKLPDLLNQYDTVLSEAEDIIRIQGKLLEKANLENPTWQSYYDQKRTELKTLTDFMDMEVNRVRGELYRKYKENHSRQLGEREINQYINNESRYLVTYQLYLEVREMLQKYQAVVDAFTTRGYALNNITKIRVASIEDAIL